MQLRKLCEADVPFILEWMQDPDINQYFRFNPMDITQESVATFVLEAQADGPDRHYACIDRNNEYLGTVSLKCIDKQNKNAEYAIAFRKKSHGTGAAAFATQEILRIAFEELLLNRVYLNVLEDNIRACAFYEKMGFSKEGVFRSHIYIQGMPKNLKWFGILRQEWMIKNERS